MNAKDISGKWGWTIYGKQGRPDNHYVADIKVEGNKLTGTVSAPGKDGKMVPSEILEGKVDGSKISFKTVRTFAANSREYLYEGTVKGDNLTGKFSFIQNDERTYRDWDAKRE